MIPKWITPPHINCDPLCGYCKYYLALSIALEALRKCSYLRYDIDDGTPVEQEEHPAIEAMKRIETLGEGE